MKNDTINEAVKNTKPSDKEMAVKLLVDLKDKVLERASAAIQAEPKKTIIISRACDNDLKRIEYTINLLKFKM